MKLSLDRKAFAKAVSAMSRAIATESFPVPHNCLRVLCHPAAGTVLLVAESLSWRALWRMGAAITRPHGGMSLLIRRADCVALLDALGDEPGGTFELDLDDASATWEVGGLTRSRSLEPVRSLFLTLAGSAFAPSRGGPVTSVRLPTSSLARIMDLFDAARPPECIGAPLTFRFAGGDHALVRVTCPYAPELHVIMRPVRPVVVEAGASSAAS